MEADDSGTVRAANLSPTELEDSPGAEEMVPRLPQCAGMPYPGLRAFRRDEVEIFFGREAALDSMVDRLASTKFLAVLGPSGCGKSSLVRTGLYTALERGYLPNAGGRWKIAELNPGRQPIRNLARALSEAIKTSAAKDADESSSRDQDLIAAHLKRGPRAVVELGEGKLLADGGNVLIVVDQFEELFRFRDYAGREEVEAFVALLLETARSSLPIHVVITMRSEYLGACSLIPGLAEQISDGMFLTPRMTREECREAIEGPPAFRSFAIEPALVARILNELQVFAPFDEGAGLDQAAQLSLQADQLPLMQHLLNRMWRRAQAEGRSGRLVLTLHDYDAAGGLTGALDDHGAEIMTALETEAGQDVTVTVERVFRALVDGPSIALAVRCPRSLRNLVAAAGGEDRRGEVERIVEAFRGPDCNFLRTSEPGLDDDVVVDIGHESLIRRWSCLRQWFEAEVKSRGMWLRLSQDAELWEANKGELLGDLGLSHYVDWWDRERPTAYLADRYKGDFEKNSAFLARSKAGAERRARIRKRLRVWLAAGTVLVIVLLIWGLIWKFTQNARLENARKAAVDSQQQTQRTLRQAEALRNDLLETRSVFRENIGRANCSEFPRRTTSYVQCIDERVEVLVDEYRALGAQPDKQLPEPLSGPAGGLAPGR